ncbi:MULTISPECIES: helix-turn-helix domain-containing protein [unclassified Gilliamella]|uniref:helix-turn-helix domain-containing protein n=1 Tax=unclassified Gilliamella TaxID=2685620 RepID=UPI00226A2C19|nr:MULTISPECIES: helix-turn-helix domain-containing protein [unclassified Gilliamella]MCX8597596.1 helix-turn-helix domain-containing protein [Gilliamella sp. B3493]MCX8599085.1 helix-turn-helix domain-containing protein [Gilliamella sp. B3486]MCX8688905.1 helix-turn-helix domain-containing protein [Gilliamella sp. B2973]MCX8704609.1 helix-turn-helix domain-containing protein [Gilliamella sp. B3127]
MSMLLMVEAMKLKVGNPLRKLVLIKLADNANDKGECFPSVSYIAEQCEISERSVQNHIKQLEVDGLLKIESRKSENGLNKSNIYYLNFSGANPAPYGANGSSSGANAAPSGESPAPSYGANPAPITSHIIEPVKEPVNNLVINGFDFSGLDGMLEKNLIDDFIKFRKSIKKPLTQGAVNYLIRELNKAVRAGYNPNELIEMTLSRGWQTFEYRYLNNQQQTPNGTPSKFMTLAERNRAVLESMRS